jgi:UPF0755 protein
VWKVTLCIAATLIFIAAFFSVHDRSKRPEHSMVISDALSLEETFEKDGSFPGNPIIKAVSRIAFLRKKINNGEYIIKHNESILSVLLKLVKGESLIRKIVIPEGYTVKMIIETIKSTDSLTGEIDEIPEEGSLMPDTYFYKFNSSRKSIIDRMKKQQQKVMKRVLEKNKTQLTEREIMTLASIIEKETSKDSERPIIASVFINRLNSGMRLQSDPTVIYAIENTEGKLVKIITKNDLKKKLPHNTYSIKGLPPTPICCPGEKSLMSVVEHKQTPYLYFVADGGGKYHRFSSTQQEHISNSKLRKREIAARSSSSR